MGLAMKYQQFIPHLNEQQRRLYVASEAMSMGEGGISLVHKASGISRVTITRGYGNLREKHHFQKIEYERLVVGGKKRLRMIHNC